MGVPSPTFAKMATGRTLTALFGSVYFAAYFRGRNMLTMDGPQTQYADIYRLWTGSIEMVSGGQDLV